ncbi:MULTISPECIES: DUF721 domain-containing protein [Pseudovibrio]|uniref:DUF721 domain-containing protein n=1 Tax=Stappiaceae TaxID=2821832 RepID=UPI0023659BE7|nr:MULTISPECIES: DciA family protein [Pseudovibrio]MDD7911263.1 DciA family protein [Pseudovibrio exalbescens]MDX5593050.1 DciA family protein [Pseudovibrio sp. SPO723]
MKTTAQVKRSGADGRQLGELIGQTMHPVARKRGFATSELLSAWPELVGERYAERVQPGQLIWPRRKTADGEPVLEPATLLVYADAPSALLLSHELPQLRERINAFFGWNAVERIRIMQRTLVRKPKPVAPKRKELSSEEKQKIKEQVERVGNPRLQAALEKLGLEIAARVED